jgi:hypothetical protein
MPEMCRSTLAAGQHPLLRAGGGRSGGAEPKAVAAVRAGDLFALEEAVHRRIPELPVEHFSEALRDLQRCMLRHDPATRSTGTS